ncbi:Trypsin-like peptidase domain-containing protein [Enhydrobacter aerosaccus]|uniref:Trypsin-like peptidase domain-containing protein n=1 Tax=Enhydrobacter aerosaccus TaxID=225324 RepID=A0A1T4MXL7_9HYPH|nr:serine protease [Enhydrobacter aerosaccus]SJZ71594.1 Trypsin-like peptidase domain-containing protein [Enhydrobacter aerosaccus]
MGCLLLAAGCTSEMYGVVGDENDVFKGTMTGREAGRIELDNGKGVRCVGDYRDRTSALLSTATAIAVLIDGVPRSLGARGGRAFLSCSNGEQAALQFSPIGGESGYGFGTTSDGRAVRITYGLSRTESQSYLKVSAAQPPASPGGPSDKTATIATGTGFYVTRQGHIVTNAHVVDRCKSVTVARVGEQMLDASVVTADKQNDLTVLLAAGPAPAVATLRSRPIRQGEPVIAFGFPLAGSLSSGGVITTGSVSALSGLHDDSRYLQISTPVQPGNSGGPLLDDSAAVVGVVSAGLRANRASGLIPQNVNFALKADVVRTFLAAAGVAAENAAGGATLSTPDVGTRARAFSVLIECKG